MDSSVSISRWEHTAAMIRCQLAMLVVASVLGCVAARPLEHRDAPGVTSCSAGCGANAVCVDWRGTLACGELCRADDECPSECCRYLEDGRYACAPTRDACSPFRTCPPGTSRTSRCGICTVNGDSTLDLFDGFDSGLLGQWNVCGDAGGSPAAEPVVGLRTGHPAPAMVFGAGTTVLGRLNVGAARSRRRFSLDAGIAFEFDAIHGRGDGFGTFVYGVGELGLILEEACDPATRSWIGVQVDYQARSVSMVVAGAPIRIVPLETELGSVLHVRVVVHPDGAVSFWLDCVLVAEADAGRAMPDAASLVVRGAGPANAGPWIADNIRVSTRALD